jgi:phosphinothricin acetyltransferase
MVEIRAATPADAEAIAAIYAHHVLHGTASFDEEPPSVAFWRDKISAVQRRRWPFLVAIDDQLVGYCYASQFRDRAAYKFTCENSVYVHPDHLGKGVGRKLLAQLIPAAREAGFKQMIAVIGGAEPASVALHAASGFTEAGRMKSVGFKFGQWLDSVYLQLSIDRDAQP